MAIKFKCSYPPSTNTYWRHIRSGKLAGRTLISEKGREYRKTIQRELAEFKRIDMNVSVKILLYPPDLRRRDIDNCLKALFDSLTHAGLWIDDCQVKKLQIEMLEKRNGGECHVEIEEIEQVLL